MEVINDYYVEEQNKGIIKVFTRMFLGLLVTAIVSYLTYKTGLYIGIPYSVLAIVEIVVVLIFSLMYRKLSATMVSVLFYSYAVVNGLTMATIFAVFDMNTISQAFFVTALLFGGLALYGYTTKKDLTKIGTIFTVALVVGLVVSVINLFARSSMISIILDWVMLLVFCGLTVHDMNNIKYMQNYVDCDNDKLYVYCAMDLYLDFINIFIRLLSIFGKTKRD